MMTLSKQIANHLRKVGIVAASSKVPKETLVAWMHDAGVLEAKNERLRAELRKERTMHLDHLLEADMITAEQYQEAVARLEALHE